MLAELLCIWGFSMLPWLTVELSLHIDLIYILTHEGTTHCNLLYIEIVYIECVVCQCRERFLYVTMG